MDVVTNVFPRAALATACALLVVFSCPAAGAQSGRKPPPRRPEPPVVAPAPETPAPAPPAESEGPKVPISAAKFVLSFNLPNNVASYVLQACVDRLRVGDRYSVLAGEDM